MNARFLIAKACLAEWIGGRRVPPVGEIFYNMTRPNRVKRGELFVEEVREEGDFQVVHLKPLPEVPLYYPKKYPWRGLCSVLDECFNERHWHNYFWGGMELREDDVALDCGAAEGLFSAIASQRARMTYVMEPTGLYLDGLRKTFDGMELVEIIAAAAGHKSGQLSMNDSDQGSKASASGEHTVEVTTIDDYFAGKSEKPTYIKADIEGYEFPMLLGAEQTIRETRPRLAITTYHPENSPEEMISFLKYLDLGYQFRLRGMSRNGHPILLQAW